MDDPGEGSRQVFPGKSDDECSEVVDLRMADTEVHVGSDSERQFEVSLTSLTDLLTSCPEDDTLDTTMNESSEDSGPHATKNKITMVNRLIKKLVNTRSENLKLRSEKRILDLDIEDVTCTLSSKETECKEMADEVLKLKTELSEKSLKNEKSEEFLWELDKMLSSCKITGDKSRGGDIEKPSRGSCPVSPADIKAKLQRKLQEIDSLKLKCRELTKKRDEYHRDIHQMKKDTKLASETNQFLYWHELKKRKEIGWNLKLKRDEMCGLHVKINEYEEKVGAQENEIQTLSEKVQILKTELEAFRLQSKDEVAKMKAEVVDYNNKIELQEKMEKEMDAMVIKAAAVPDPTGLSAILEEGMENSSSFSSDSKRRLQQAFVLAQQVFTLEQTVEEQKTELSKLWDEREHARVTLDSYKGALAMAGKPVCKLVTCLAEKNTEIAQLKEKVAYIEAERNGEKECQRRLYNAYTELMGRQRSRVFPEVQSKTRQSNVKYCDEKAKSSSVLVHAERMIDHGFVHIDEVEGKSDILPATFQIPSDFVLSEEEEGENKENKGTDVRKKIQLLPRTKGQQFDEDTSPRPPGGRGRGHRRGIHGESGKWRTPLSTVGFSAQHPASFTSSSSALVLSKLVKADETDS